MEIPISQFRRDIFAFANRALDGEPVAVSYKGKLLRLVPESSIDPATRFDKLTPLQVVNPEFSDFETLDMLPEMQAEWEKDWDEL